MSKARQSRRLARWMDEREAWGHDMSISDLYWIRGRLGRDWASATVERGFGDRIDEIEARRNAIACTFCGASFSDTEHTDRERAEDWDGVAALHKPGCHWVSVCGDGSKIDWTLDHAWENAAPAP